MTLCGVRCEENVPERLNEAGRPSNGGLAMLSEFARDTPDRGVAVDRGVPAWEAVWRGDCTDSICFMFDDRPGVLSAAACLTLLPSSVPAW